MTTGEDRNKDRFKAWKHRGPWKLLFHNHGAIKLTQNCVCFTNPCINLFVPTSVTRKYHLKILELLHLLQCISAYLQNTLPWASWEKQYLNFSSADFRSCLVARGRKPIKCVLKTWLTRSTHAVPIRPYKANGWSYSSQKWHHRRVCDCLSNSYRPGLSKFFGRGPHKLLHNSWGPNTLRNVIFSGYVTFYQINALFVNRLHYSFIIGKMCFEAGWNGFRRSDLARGPSFGEPCYKLWRGVGTLHTTVGVQHQLWTVML